MDNQQLMLPMGYIDHNADGDVINQRVKDGYVNATAICKASNKEWKHYYALEGTKAFVMALSSEVGILPNELVEVNRGGVPHLQGTWVHPQVAIHLGQWASPKFAVLVSKWVMDWLTGNVSKGNNTPYHLRRYFENKPNVPYGYFSMLNEAYITLIGPLEQLGYLVSDRQVPDISFGQTFSRHLRSLGNDVDNFPEYPHKYEDGRVVSARAYPNELLSVCQKFLIEDWLKNRAEKYFAKRDKSALPYLNQMMNLPNLREVMGYIEERPLSEFDKNMKKALDYQGE